MTSSDDLSPEAKHLLRAARGGDRATPGQIQDAVATFRAARRDAVRGRHRSLAPSRGVRRSTPWAVLVAILSGSLGAYATVGQSFGLPLPGWWPDFATWSQLDTAAPLPNPGRESARDTRAGMREPAARAPRASAAPVPLAELAVPELPTIDPVEPVEPAEPAERVGAVETRPNAPVGLPALGAERAGVAGVDTHSARATPSPGVRLSAKDRRIGLPPDAAEAEHAPGRNLATSPVPPTSAAGALDGTNGRLALEVETLTRARDALNAGDCAAARPHLDRHRLEFPRGALSEERQALTAICECRTGAGSAAAELYVSRRAESPLTRRVAKECGFTRAE